MSTTQINDIIEYLTKNGLTPEDVENNGEYASLFQNRGCVVFWDGKSKGTKNDIELSKKYNVPLRIVKFR